MKAAVSESGVRVTPSFARSARILEDAWVLCLRLPCGGRAAVDSNFTRRVYMVLEVRQPRPLISKEALILQLTNE